MIYAEEQRLKDRYKMHYCGLAKCPYEVSLHLIGNFGHCKQTNQ